MTINNKLLELKCTSLGSLSIKITQGPNPKFIDSGKICLNGRNVKNFRVDIENSNFVSEKEFEQLKNYKIRVGDILITLKGLGSIGKTGYVSSDIEAIFSRDIGLLRIKNNLERFVYAFLLSKYGEKQIERAITGGTGQLTLATSYLKKVIIPVFPKDEILNIDCLIEESEENYELSRKSYKEAENLLLEELGLKGYRPEEALSSVVNFSDVKESSRVDADYFQPKYSDLIEKIRSLENKKLEQLGKKVKKKIKIIPDEVYKYIEISDVNVSSGNADFKEIPAKDLPVSAQIAISGGELIISKVRPTRGAISILPDEFNNNFVCSSAFSVFEVNEELREYLFVFLRSIAGRLQFEKPTTGTSYPTITDQDIGNVVVPILPKEIQQKIADLVRKSHETRKKSKELLEEAKRKVEEMIERGGEKEWQEK